MGLDMCLSARYHVTPDQDVNLVSRVKSFFEDMDDVLPLSELKFEAVYWRKANAIHRWFVTNVQDGDDNCGTYHVSQQQVYDLMDVIKKVLADHSLAPSLLPTQGGFFFGNLDYSEHYYEELARTLEVLAKVLPLADKHNLWFEYHSSW